MDGESRRVRDSDLDDDGHIIDMADRENMTLPATRKSSRASLAPTRGILKASNFDGDYTLPVDIHSANTSRKRRVSFAPQPTTHNFEAAPNADRRPATAINEPLRKKRATISFAAPPTLQTKLNLSPLRRSPRLNPSLAKDSDDESAEMDMSMDQVVGRSPVPSERDLISLDSPSPAPAENGSANTTRSMSPSSTASGRSPNRTKKRSMQPDAPASPRRSPRLAARKSLIDDDMELTDIFASRPTLYPTGRTLDDNGTLTDAAHGSSLPIDRGDVRTHSKLEDDDIATADAAAAVADQSADSSAMDLTQAAGEVLNIGEGPQGSIDTGMLHPRSHAQRESIGVDLATPILRWPRDSMAMELTRPLGTTIAQPRDSIAMELTRPLGVAASRPRESNVMELTRPLGIISSGARKLNAAPISQPHDSMAMDFTKPSGSTTAKLCDSNVMELTRPLKLASQKSEEKNLPSPSQQSAMTESALPRQRTAQHRESNTMDLTKPLSRRPRDSIAMDLTTAFRRRQLPRSPTTGLGESNEASGESHQIRDSTAMELTKAFPTNGQMQIVWPGAQNVSSAKLAKMNSVPERFSHAAVGKSPKTRESDTSDLRRAFSIAKSPLHTTILRQQDSTVLELAHLCQEQKLTALNDKQSPNKRTVRESDIMDLTSSFKGTFPSSLLDNRDDNWPTARTSDKILNPDLGDPLGSDELVFTVAQAPRRLTLGRNKTTPKLKATPSTHDKLLRNNANLLRKDATPTLDLTGTFLLSRGRSTQQGEVKRSFSPTKMATGSPVRKEAIKTPQRVPRTPMDDTTRLSVRTPAERLLQKILSFTPKPAAETPRSVRKGSPAIGGPDLPHDVADEGKITLHKFLDMAGVSFMDEFLAATRRESSFGVSNLTVTQTQPKLVDFVSAAHRLPVREMYGNGASDLRRSIKSAKEGFTEYESQIEEEPPAIMDVFLTSSREERASISGQLMRMKTFGRLYAKGSWYDWRLTNTRTLKGHLDSQREDLLADREILVKQQQAQEIQRQEISAKFDELVERLEHLKQQQRLQEDTDREEYIKAQNRVAELKKRVSDLQSTLDAQSTELVSLQNNQRALVTKKQEIWQEILDTEAIMQDNRLTDDQEVFILQEHAKWLQRILGVRNYKFSEHSMSLTLAHELELCVDIDTLKLRHTLKSDDRLLLFFYEAYREYMSGLENVALQLSVLNASNLWYRALTLYDTAQLLGYQFQTTFDFSSGDEKYLSVVSKLLLSDGTPVNLKFTLSPTILKGAAGDSVDVQVSGSVNSHDNERLKSLATELEESMASAGLESVKATFLSIMDSTLAAK